MPRPWLAIHTLCQVSIPTARNRMPALKSSCPDPSKRAAICPAKLATRQAPKTPAATPYLTQRPRHGTPLVAARTMPTINPASITSRNTIRRVANILTSSEDDDALRRGIVFTSIEPQYALSPLYALGRTSDLTSQSVHIVILSIIIVAIYGHGW